MTLFEASIHKLDIPKCVMDDIVAIRNICMEAEAPAQPQAAQPAQQPQKQTQPHPQQQNATPQQPQQQPQQQASQQNAQAQTGAEQAQGQQPAQESPQEQGQQQRPQENKQANQQDDGNITEDKVDKNKLLKEFNNYLAACKQKLQKKIENEFPEYGKTIMSKVIQAAKENSPLDFNTEIASFLTQNGKLVTDKNVLNDIRGRLEKYFGVKFKAGQPAAQEQKPQGKPNGEQAPQEQTQPAK
ncbi:MAG: hypothetical protein IKN15_02380 [Bacteroidaceae bacterium]|nr:hypothetical protein [Bacteroidaceae bacterium]